MQRFGPRFWIARIMVTWAVLSAGMIFITTPTQFYVLRFLLGVAEAGFFPASFSISRCGSPPGAPPALSGCLSW